jgi:4-hydroxybenzoate polyprenyltransferase/phosphoserine phosphatase
MNQPCPVVAAPMSLLDSVAGFQFNEARERDTVIKNTQPMNSPPANQPRETAPADRQVPLCVDLDGTLINTDCLWEGIIRLFFRDFSKFAAVMAGSWRGRPWIKREVSKGVSLAADVLPFNAEVVEMIRREKAAGRKILLVTASDQAMADEVAAHLKLFDEVIGSDGVRNLRGGAKAALLVERFGRGGFDYAGDSAVDLPVWEAARHAYLVRVPPAVKARVSRASSATTMGLGGGTWRAVVRALRPQHWVKNTLVFLPVLTAHDWHQADMWWRLAGFFAALCCGASAVYLVNDLADIESDRRHRDKWRRPVASGALSIPGALALIPVCLGLAAICCRLPGWTGFELLCGYLALTSAYSFYLKRIPILDILLLSGFYVFRIVAGAVLAPVTLSPWLIAFAMFLFLSLAAAKRYVELTTLTHDGGAKVSRGYLREDYPMIAAFGVNCSCLAVLVLGLYVNSDTFRNLYSRAAVFWMLCPLLLYWLVRVWILAGRRQLHDDPVVFAIKDRVTWFIAALGVVVFYVAMAGNAR